MLRIKLSRVGKRKAPMYRILVLERARDPWGDYLENVGFYNPRTNPSTIEFKKDRVEYWMSKGAQPTDTVHNLLIDAGIIKDKKRSASTISKKRQASLAEAQGVKGEAKAAAQAKTESPAQETKPEAPKEAPKEEAKPEEKSA